MIDLIHRIADAIPDSLDLGDQREVIAELVAKGYSLGEIIANMDEAIEIVRVRRVTEIAECAAGVAMIAGAIWFGLVALSGRAMAAENGLPVEDPWIVANAHALAFGAIVTLAFFLWFGYWVHSLPCDFGDDPTQADHDALARGDADADPWRSRDSERFM